METVAANELRGRFRGGGEKVIGRGGGPRARESHTSPPPKGAASLQRGRSARAKREGERERETKPVAVSLSGRERADPAHTNAGRQTELWSEKNRERERMEGEDCR